MTSELLLIILMVAGIVYWLNAMRSKEIAREAGKRACDRFGVSFLDDTVVMSKLRLRRNVHGQMVFFRVYRFEFTSDGYQRYSAHLSMLGQHVVKVDMGVYRNPEEPQQ
jgi:hypothetical protein